MTDPPGMAAALFISEPSPASGDSIRKLPRHVGAVKPEGKFEKRNERSVKRQILQLQPLTADKL